MTVADTSVLLDIFLDGAAHGDSSAARLAAALDAGSVVVNDVIAAELAPAFPDDESMWATLRRAQIRHQPFPRSAVFLAGQAFLGYRRAGGGRQRILPDFMIAAHAMAAGARLLTRDKGFYRRYFPRLSLVD